MRLDVVHPQVLGELVSVFHRPFLKYTKDKDVIGNGQLGLVKEESPLTDLTGFCVELTNSVDDREQQRLVSLPLITNTLNMAVFSPPHWLLMGLEKQQKEAKENLYLLLDVRENMMIKYEENTDALNTFFASVFNCKTSCLQGTQSLS